MNKLFRALKRAAADFSDDECMASAAAIAYYTIFSLPPLLVLVFFLAGLFGVSHERVAEVMKEQVGIPADAVSGDASGGETADAEGSDPQASGAGLTQVADRAKGQSTGPAALGPLARIIGIVLLVFSATGVFVQLQTALNRAWEVEPDPEQGGVMNFLLKRLLSLSMIVVIAFLLLVSLILTATLEEITQMILGREPGTVGTVIGMLLNALVTFAVATLLFAAMYKLLPDAKLQWRDTWIGAGMTAFLFVVGKLLLGWWLQRSETGATWGTAAGSLIAVLVWVYYTSLIILFGAELTQSWMNISGREIQPEKGAVKIKEEKRILRDHQ